MALSKHSLVSISSKLQAGLNKDTKFCIEQRFY
jgi:hypothetical protein